MFNKSKQLLLSLTLVSVASCSISKPVNKTLSPPIDSKLVTVEVKNPSPYTKPFPLEVRYISHQCKKKRISGADGSIITEPSYNVIKIPMQQKNNNIWKTKVAMTGGGSCEWTLSAITLGIEYVDATHIANDLVPGTAVGATIAFDYDASRNGQFYSTYGDLLLTPKYYPYISEWNMGVKRKELSLLGKESFLSLKSINLNEIKFHPILDEGKIVKYIGIEKKQMDRALKLFILTEVPTLRVRFSPITIKLTI